MGNLHLVTGYAGAAHVTAADAASLNAAIVGPDNYVLNRGNQFAASVVTNNKITIADGDLLMQGRHIRLNEGSTVDLTIENGASGYYRNDLIVARYTMDSNTGVEDCNLVVIKGTAVSGNPSDPEYTSGDIINDHVLQADMPLYRVPLSGLNVQTLVPLFTVVNTNLQNSGNDKQESTENLATGTTLADGDYFPFYDVSVSGHRKVLWSRIVTMIRTALFGSLNGILKANGSGYVSAQTVDTTPIANSTNLVTSGGVEAAFAKRTWDVLWENASPTSAFAEQTLTFDDLSKYDVFAITFFRNSEIYTRDTIICDTKGLTDSIRFNCTDSAVTNSFDISVRQRVVYIDRGANSITFSTGWLGGSSTGKSDEILIPVYIRGFKS